MGVGVAHAAKPEDVFKGKIIITKDRLPARFASPGAFISALQSKKIDKIWPVEEKGADHGVWKLEYIAFFAQPLDDNEIVLDRELLFEFEIDFVVLLVAADEIAATGEDLEVRDGVPDTQSHEYELGPEEDAGVFEDGVGEPEENSRHR